MRKKNMKKESLSIVKPTKTKPAHRKEFIYHIPAGVRFDDIYICTVQVAIQLMISKRTVRNMRVAGKLSYIDKWGKIYYYKQEIAGMMEESRINRTKKMIWVAIASLAQIISFCFLDDSLLIAC